MRVLLISHTCQSPTEGQPRAQELASLPGLELCVLTPDRWKHYGHWRKPKSIDHPNFRYEIGKVRWPWAGPAQFYLHRYQSLGALFQQFKPDIIDIWEEPWSLVSAQACRLRNRLLPHAKIVSETEQNINKSLPFPFEKLRRYSLKHADFVVGRNHESLGIVREKGYVGPADVVPNGVDAELFHPLDREKCRQQHSMNGFVVGYVGRLVEEKGLADLLAAAALLDANVQIVFVGTGPFEAALRVQAIQMGILQRVRFLPACNLESLPSIMNAIDCLVLPSRTTARWKEQFGRVIIEAHACATPVIGSDSGAIPDVVGAGGIIFPEGQPAALAQAIRQLAENPIQRQNMGRRGREQVEANCTWRQIAAKFHSIYQRLLHANPIELSLHAQDSLEQQLI